MEPDSTKLRFTLASCATTVRQLEIETGIVEQLVRTALIPHPNWLPTTYRLGTEIHSNHAIPN